MSAPGTLVYPEFDGLARFSDNKQEVFLSQTISDWDFHYGDYEFIGTITASLDSRDDFDGDVVGVFVDNECRGIAERMYFPFNDTYVYSIQVYSNVVGGEEMTFKYYDAMRDEVVEYSETLTFTSNMVVGDGFNTFGLNSEEKDLFQGPATYGLSDAYPNPFNPTTTLSFALPIASEVSLKVYNMQGREVSSLISGNMAAGYHTITWYADSYSSGLYFIKMIADEYMETQKLILIK